MPKVKRTPPEKPKAENVTKTISLPGDLAGEADRKVALDPELDFSKYVRGLIRRDLAADDEKAA